MNDFLFSANGKAYLLEEYIKQGKSTYTIAKERCTYANLVRRALLHHGILLRSKAEAQRLVVQDGRHPTKGGSLSRQTRDRIGESVGFAWGQLSPEVRADRVRQAKDQWQATSEEERTEFRRLAMEGLRKAADQGSKVERFLSSCLQQMGYSVQTRAEAAGKVVDLLLPQRRIVIQVDGPGHFLPVWGERRLDRVMREDAKTIQALLAAGLTVVRVKNLVRHISELQKRKLLTELLSVLKSDQLKTPCLVEMEIK